MSSVGFMGDFNLDVFIIQHYVMIRYFINSFGANAALHWVCPQEQDAMLREIMLR